MTAWERLCECQRRKEVGVGVASVPATPTDVIETTVHP
jgi:hypothetical protein